MNSMAKLSVPCSRLVRGYEIRRLPLGKYLQAMELIRTMPDTVMNACFPGMSTEDMLEKFKHINAKTLVELLITGMGTAGAQIVQLLAVTMEIDANALLADENVGLDGLAEMVQAFWELNRLENFILAVRTMGAQMHRAMTPDGRTGSSV